MLSWCWNEVLKLVRTCTHSGVHHRDGVFRPVCTVYSAAFGTSACHFGQLLQLLQHYPAYQDLNKIGNYWIELITKHGSWNWIEIIKILIRFLSIYWIIENTVRNYRVLRHPSMGVLEIDWEWKSEGRPGDGLGLINYVVRVNWVIIVSGSL